MNRDEAKYVTVGVGLAALDDSVVFNVIKVESWIRGLEVARVILLRRTEDGFEGIVLVLTRTEHL